MSNHTYRSPRSSAPRPTASTRPSATASSVPRDAAQAGLVRGDAGARSDRGGTGRALAGRPEARLPPGGDGLTAGGPRAQVRPSRSWAARSSADRAAHRARTTVKPARSASSQTSSSSSTRTLISRCARAVAGSPAWCAGRAAGRRRPACARARRQTVGGQPVERVAPAALGTPGQIDDLALLGALPHQRDALRQRRVVRRGGEERVPVAGRRSRNRCRCAVSARVLSRSNTATGGLSVRGLSVRSSATLERLPGILAPRGR